MTAIVMGGLFLFLAIGVPVFMALIIPSAVLVLNSPAIADVAIVQRMFFSIDRIALMAIPFFIFCAGIMSAGQIAKRLANLARAFCGHLPGGMAIAVVLASMLFGAITGVGTTAVVAIGGIMYSLMKSGNYGEDFSAGLILTSSTLGMLIPPSVPYLLFALATSTSVATLFLSGVGAGVIIGLAFIAYSYYYAKKKKLPLLEKASWKERLAALKEAIPSLLLIVLIIGGIYGGVFTVTESAGVAAFYALFVEMVIYRSFSFKGLAKVALESGKTIAMVMLLIAAGGALSWAMTTLSIPQMVAAFMGNMNRVAVLLVINVIFLIAGMLLDPNSSILILVPLVFPAAMAAGIDPIHLGTIVVINMSIGMITPPFALNIYVGSNVFKQPVDKLMMAIIPFLVIFLIMLIIFTFIPALSTWLPSVMLS